MEIFDKIGKKASEAYKMTADKTGKIAKETKMRMKMNELKSEINDLYEEIGKKVYEKHTREESISIKKDLEEECTKIDMISDEIEELLQQCLELKDRKQCPKCFKEIDKEYKFCPNCGKKQKQEEVVEEQNYEGENPEEKIEKVEETAKTKKDASKKTEKKEEEKKDEVKIPEVLPKEDKK